MSVAPVHPPRLLPGVIGDSLLQGRTAFLVLFTAVHVVLAGTSSGLRPVVLVQLLLICGAAAMFTQRVPMGPALAVLVATALLAATAIACAGLPFGHDPPGYSAWQFGAISIVLLCFTVQGRYVLAAGAMGGVAAIAIGWSLATAHGPWPGVALVDRHVATLFVGGCFTAGYRRTMAAARVFRSLAGQRRTFERTALARAGARRAAAEDVLEQAGPMLAAIAEGRRLSDVDRRELVVIEGALRDRIRAARLQTGRLPEAIAAARRRGVDVLLLDESEPTALDAHRAAAEWLAGHLDATPTGRFVGRVRAEPGVLSASAGSGESSTTAEFAVEEDQRV